MEVSEKVTKIKCYECHNIIKVHYTKNGSKVGKCPVCKTVFSAKEAKPNKQKIKLVLNIN